jgi:hypothetical protein
MPLSGPRSFSLPSTLEQRLAALQHQFDWLVAGQVVPTNPAASVRDAQHNVKIRSSKSVGAPCRPLCTRWLRRSQTTAWLYEFWHLGML